MKALIIVDMQNDFITGPLGSKEAVDAVENLCAWIKENIHEGDKVIVTQDTHYAELYFDTQEGKKLPVLHCVPETEGWKLYPKLRPILKDIYCIEKETFGAIDLAYHLPYNIDEVYFAGVCTDICVISNALILKTDKPELPIKVLGNCCAGTTPEKHEAALSVMESCQIDVI